MTFHQAPQIPSRSEAREVTRSAGAPFPVQNHTRNIERRAVKATTCLRLGLGVQTSLNPISHRSEDFTVPTTTKGINTRLGQQSRLAVKVEWNITWRKSERRAEKRRLASALALLAWPLMPRSAGLPLPSPPSLPVLEALLLVERSPPVVNSCALEAGGRRSPPALVTVLLVY